MLEKLKYNKGFTLIEVFIAVSVLSIGVVGAFGVLPTMIRNQIMNSDAFVAGQIANEGIELVRNLRDSNWLKGQSWTTGLVASPNCSSGCEIDYDDPALQLNQNRFLQKDANGFYNYETGTNSKFRRKINITQNSPTDPILYVKVEVSWNGSGSPFIAEENFYDWR